MASERRHTRTAFVLCTQQFVTQDFREVERLTKNGDPSDGRHVPERSHEASSTLFMRNVSNIPPANRRERRSAGEHTSTEQLIFNRCSLRLFRFLLLFILKRLINSFTDFINQYLPMRDARLLIAKSAKHIRNLRGGKL